MCDEVNNDFLAALKIIPGWFVTSKMIKSLLLLYTQMIINSILMKVSGDAALCCNEMGILIYFNNINLDDTNYDEDAFETIIYISLLAWHIKFEKVKHLKNCLFNAYSMKC